MAGVYSELRAFVMEHRKCAGSRRADASLLTPSGYSVRLKCGCGQEFTRWVTTVGAAGIRELVPPDASSRRGSAQTAADAIGGAYRLDACATLPPYGQLHCGWQAPSARVRFDYPRRSLKDHCAARDRSHRHSTRNQRDGRRASADGRLARRRRCPGQPEGEPLRPRRGVPRRDGTMGRRWPPSISAIACP